VYHVTVDFLWSKLREAFLWSEVLQKGCDKLGITSEFIFPGMAFLDDDCVDLDSIFGPVEPGMTAAHEPMQYEELDFSGFNSDVSLDLPDWLSELPETPADLFPPPVPQAMLDAPNISFQQVPTIVGPPKEKIHFKTTLFTGSTPPINYQSPLPKGLLDINDGPTKFDKGSSIVPKKKKTRAKRRTKKPYKYPPKIKSESLPEGQPAVVPNVPDVAKVSASPIKNQEEPSRPPSYMMCLKCMKFVARPFDFHNC